MIVPSPQAAKQATLGLALIQQQLGEHFRDTPEILLAKKIVAREPLNELEARKVKDFSSKGYEATPAWVAAFNLYGGDPMLDQVSALPDEPKIPLVTVSAGLRADTQTLLRTNMDHPCDSITLAVLGDVQGLHEGDRLQAETACEFIAESAGSFDCAARWEMQTITASGYERRVIFSDAALHSFYDQTETILNRYGVPYDDSVPWTPMLVRSVSAQSSEHVFASFRSVVDRVVLDWGGESSEYVLKGARRAAVEVKPPRTIENLGGRVFKRLQQLDERWLTGLESIMDMAVNQALEKVGRTLKKKAPEVYMTVTAAEMSPVAVSVLADASVLEAVNVNQLIAAPVDDACRLAKGLTETHVEAVAAAVGGVLGLDVELSGYKTSLNDACRMLKQRLKQWVTWRLCTSEGEAKLDDFTRVVDAPAVLVRDFAAVAGGDSVVAGDDGLVPAGEGNLLPALALGSFGLGVVDKAFQVLRGSSLSGFRVREGVLSGVERDAVEALGPDSVLRVGASYTWTPNYYGKIRTEHHPRHEPNFGVVVEDVSEVSGDRPGDHPFCKCGWRPDFGLVVG